MVTAVINVFMVFRDFVSRRLPVQRMNVTEEQASTLFWINLLFGTGLGLLAVAMAPLVVAFYHEQRLLGVTAVLATAFLFQRRGGATFVDAGTPDAFHHLVCHRHCLVVRQHGGWHRHGAARIRILLWSPHDGDPDYLYHRRVANDGMGARTPRDNPDPFDVALLAVQLPSTDW